jgi:branched-chain amino acid transport system ATP-binding protein
MSLLQVENLSQSFGGLKVLDGISFSLESGQKVGLIGPNGAGKTTLLNVLSGLQPFQSGRIHFVGHEITRMPACSRVSLGLARSFQMNTLFPNLNLLTNVLLAIQGTKTVRFQMLRPLTAYKDNLARAQELLELMDLWDKRDCLIANLSHGEQRQVEILLTLASQPKLIMLDEPNAGLSSAETTALIEIIRNLGEDITVFFSAHDMDLVFDLAERVMVLYYGQIIAQGNPKEIRSDSKVMQIYLGTGEEHA